MLENATRICDAKFGSLVLFEGNNYQRVGLYNAPAAYMAGMAQNPVLPLSASLHLTRLVICKQVLHVHDILVEDPDAGIAKLGGARTIIVVPILKDGELMGAISVFRQEVRPFTDKQIELVQNFAAQAVIAIENARLLNELRHRTNDLTEALEQQTATSEVLQVISRSPGELGPVFQAILENATRICGAEFGNLMLFEADKFHRAALYNAPSEYLEFSQKSPLLDRFKVPSLNRLTETKKPVQVADMAVAEPESPMTRFGRARTLLTVPMLKENKLVGAIGTYRQEVRPFTDKQIELVQNFAAQAVIAIENAGLLNELRRRTSDLSESLEQQTATSEVLRVISSSPGELGRVFDSIMQNATRLCEASFGNLLTYEDGLFRRVALHNAPQSWIEEQRRDPIVPHGAPAYRIVQTKQPIHVADAAAEYADKSIVRIAGARTILVVPMFKDDMLAGAIGIYRREVRPFTDKQIDLVKNFAAQAVIAIENTRLLNELRESLRQQTATSDVLQVISRSQGDLDPVFNTILENAVRICGAKFGNLVLAEGKCFRTVALFGAPQAFLEERRREPVIRPRPGSDLDQIRTTKKIVHVADMQVNGAASTAIVELAGARTFLNVPMLKDNELVGSIGIYRQEVQPFTDKQVELVQNFANQAVIAIENTRLLSELRQRTDDLSKSLENLQTAQDRLVQTQKLASLGQLTAGIAHEIKNPLNFVNNFSSLSTELLGELQEVMKHGQFDPKARAEIDELTETLRANLDKIEQHGKRADSIVKNMLLHSREGSGEHRPVDVNALVEESLNLAYHGARAEKQGFNIALERTFDPAAGEVDVFPQEITRVLLNLISNGFYAATKRKAGAVDRRYEPTLTAATKNLGDRVEIRIRDNGTGIPPEVKEKMFNPFFTTKPAGEGTGLGLSISHDIIVKQHGGAIEVDTVPGEYTEFRIILPRTAATLATGDRA